MVKSDHLSYSYLLSWSVQGLGWLWSDPFQHNCIVGAFSLNLELQLLTSWWLTINQGSSATQRSLWIKLESPKIQTKCRRCESGLNWQSHHLDWGFLYYLCSCVTQTSISFHDSLTKMCYTMRENVCVHGRCNCFHTAVTTGTVVFKIIAVCLKTWIKLEILIIVFISMHWEVCTFRSKSKKWRKVSFLNFFTENEEINIWLFKK